MLPGIVQQTAFPDESHPLEIIHSFSPPQNLKFQVEFSFFYIAIFQPSHMVLSLLLLPNSYFQGYKPPTFSSLNPTSTASHYLVFPQVVNAVDHSLNPEAPVLMFSVCLLLHFTDICLSSILPCWVGCLSNPLFIWNFVSWCQDPSTHGGTDSTILSDG